VSVPVTDPTVHSILAEHREAVARLTRRTLRKLRDAGVDASPLSQPVRETDPVVFMERWLGDRLAEGIEARR
jgi:hypothetical protein